MPTGPDYPHYPSAHEPPTRRSLSRLWLLAAFAFVVFGIAATATAFTVISRSSFWDLDTYIDEPEILTVVEHECDRMTKTVNGLTVTGSPHHQAEIIEKQNAAAQRMIDAVLALDPEVLAADKPTLAWAADWQQLLKARSAYADQVELGAEPDLEEPKDADGDSILDRMDWASEPECVIPEALLDPYPEFVEDI
ncbi:MAG: hypothetical protein M3Q98_00155 [Actinomycetota bacterium]|nr:hypothetical protein [Actinomycetota bacterium]